MARNWREAQVKDGSAHSAVRVLGGGKNTTGRAGIRLCQGGQGWPDRSEGCVVPEPSPSVQLGQQ